MIRNNWTIKEIEEIYNLPLMELVYKAASVHREYHDPQKVKVSTLISVKTGACSEDCSYCAQSARYNSGLESHPLMQLEEVLKNANEIKAQGVRRVCLSASWRKIPDNKEFERVLEMIKAVKGKGMGVCCTMGLLDLEQAVKLKEAGVTAFNHNLDTSDAYYDKIITTRTYTDRLETIDNMIEAGLQHCSGGIIGLGESHHDRISMLHTLATLRKHPYTVPFNTLVPIKGTPLENNKLVEVWDMIRIIATARILMPESMICLAAGRKTMTMEGQAICFMAGANAIFVGKKLLTTPNPDFDDDMEMLDVLGLQSMDQN
jgi:biotin synthase